MAKENKKNEQQGNNAAVADVDNISTLQRNGNVATVELSQKVYADIQKDMDERMIEQIKSRTLKAEYMRRRKLLQLRARRRENDITLKFLKKAEILQYQMAGFQLTEEHIQKMGGKDGKLELEIVKYVDGEAKKEKQTFTLEKGKESVWVPASITAVEYDELCGKMQDEEEKERTKSDNELQKDLRELENRYPGYFSYSWRW